ncbi:MAG: 4Fe-4S binding protein [Synergistaceae bacterium]|jgi:NAD-dependent dihydropyrimidine dehydrogenase PreA subunit|nr:4Fe-4S binding protein [Synergistaceae bacterium]
MLRGIIKIDGDKCDGCGLCADVCHEGAIAVLDGKAALIRGGGCDGLGDCLPACPAGAISFEERDAEESDAGAAKAAPAGGCPGSAVLESSREAISAEAHLSASLSGLSQWPVQIGLISANAPCFDGARLLISADCAAYARAGFHGEFMARRVTLIGCPKLDGVDYSLKLAEIIGGNEIKSVTVVRMEVPCCGGIEHAAVSALKNSGKMIPWRVVTLSVKGEILED